jgi:filamin
MEVNLEDVFAHNLNMKLTAPSGSDVTITRTTTTAIQNMIQIGFATSEVGTHRLDLDYSGVVINGSPFDVKVYDASRISVGELSQSEVNKPCEFTIDASGAGEGQLEIAVNDGLVKNNVKQLRPGYYLVSFVPVKAELYVIDVKFNNELVPGKLAFFNFI